MLTKEMSFVVSFNTTCLSGQLSFDTTDFTTTFRM